MTAKDAIRQSMDISDMLAAKYLDDLDDAALMIRPVPGMNHIAWQLGHLITSEWKSVEAIKPGTSPSLPEGFYEKHAMAKSTVDDPAAFFSKDVYLETWKNQRDATRSLLESLTDAELAGPAPEAMRNMCPTVGHTLNLLSGLHPLMHIGQFVGARRSLQKPIAF